MLNAGALRSPHRRRRVPPADEGYGDVRLHQALERPRNGPPFALRDGRWELTFRRPQVDRLEYGIAADGEERERGAIEFPGYGRPPGSTRPTPARPPASTRSTQLWSPPDASPRAPLPLLVVHDGTAYEREAQLTRLVAHLFDEGRIPRCRVALLDSPRPRRGLLGQRPLRPRAHRPPARDRPRDGARRARRQPRRPRAPPRPRAAPGRVRRADAAVRLLLPPALGRPRGGLRALQPDRPLRRHAAARRHGGDPDPDRDHVRRTGGEPRQQPRDGERAAPPGPPRHVHDQPRRPQLHRLARCARPVSSQYARRRPGGRQTTWRATHLIGLLLGTEEDWSGAFEALLERTAPAVRHGGETHEFTTERVTIEPFDLRATPRHSLVIDRLAHWYYVPREWLKKIALMDGVYLMNNPFTFQSMEKHSAYCAMMRLGLKVPDTWLVPYKQPLADERFAYTASRYNQPFDLAEIAGADRLPAVHEAVRRRRLGRREPGPRRARARGALRRLRPAADAPAEGRRRLRGLRPLALDRPGDDGHALRPGAPAARPLPGRPRLPRRADGRRGDHDRPHRERLLPLGVQLVRDADPRRRGLPHRLRQRVPGRLADLAPLLLPVGDQGAAALEHLLLRDRSADARRHGPGAVVRGRGAGHDATRRSSPPTVRSRTRTSPPRSTPSSATATSPTSTRRWRSTSPRPTSTACSSRRSRRTFPPAEHERFVAHYRGLLAAWVGDQATA